MSSHDRFQGTLLLGAIVGWVACASVGTLRADSWTDDAKAKYEHKFAEVLQDGLVVAYCSGVKFMDIDVTSHRNTVALGITENGIDKVVNAFGCPTQPIRKGEVLIISNVRTANKGARIYLDAESTRHSLTRGIGAFEHESIEVGKINLAFASNGFRGRSQGGGDNDQLISKWLRLSDTAERAKLGNTASMVEVKQVKLGMSFAEVEQALGLPVTRVELNTKVLYKYKDMTVEFQDGKVSDVR